MLGIDQVMQHRARGLWRPAHALHIARVLDPEKAPVPPEHALGGHLDLRAGGPARGPSVLPGLPGRDILVPILEGIHIGRIRPGRAAVIRPQVGTQHGDPPLPAFVRPVPPFRLDGLMHLHPLHQRHQGADLVIRFPLECFLETSLVRSPHRRIHLQPQRLEDHADPRGIVAVPPLQFRQVGPVQMLRVHPHDQLPAIPELCLRFEGELRSLDSAASFFHTFGNSRT